MIDGETRQKSSLIAKKTSEMIQWLVKKQDRKVHWLVEKQERWFNDWWRNKMERCTHWLENKRDDSMICGETRQRFTDWWKDKTEWFTDWWKDKRDDSMISGETRQKGSLTGGKTRETLQWWCWNKTEMERLEKVIMYWWKTKLKDSRIGWVKKGQTMSPLQTP